MSRYDEFKKMLESISNTGYKKKDKNYFDVAGYPHYENVVSNILSFFFNDEEHGFKDLWLKSLLECYNDVTSNDLDFSVAFSVIDARREVKTEDDNRIDILIYANDFAVLIENKIYSGVHNPFKSYHDYVKKEDKDIQVYEILLTLKKEKNQIDKGYAFYNITYNKLINKVKKNIGKYIGECDEKWLIYMNEFMNNIANLESGYSMETNKELNKLIENNNDIVSDFFEVVFNEIENRVNLIKSITARFNELTDNRYKAYDYNTTLKITKGSSYCSSVVDIKVDTMTLVIETYVMKINSKEKYEQGNILYVAIWNRFKKDYDFSSYLREIEKIKDVKPIEIKSPNWGKHYLLKEYNLSNDVSIDNVVKLMIDVAKLIK